VETSKKLLKGTRFLSAEEARAERKWKIIDAKGMVVGRLASEVATILRGKNKPQFSPHNDCGDFVVVLNADKVVFTGTKPQTKIYYKHTGFVGNMKSWTAGRLLAEKPERVIVEAVKGMLPKTPLGRKQLKKMKVYLTDSHPHAAQVTK
jgi:large subunit ribosomal protein L13